MSDLRKDLMKKNLYSQGLDILYENSIDVFLEISKNSKNQDKVNMLTDKLTNIWNEKIEDIFTKNEKIEFKDIFMLSELENYGNKFYNFDFNLLEKINLILQDEGDLQLQMKSHAFKTVSQFLNNTIKDIRNIGISEVISNFKKGIDGDSIFFESNKIGKARLKLECKKNSLEDLFGAEKGSKIFYEALCQEPRIKRILQRRKYTYHTVKKLLKDECDLNLDNLIKIPEKKSTNVSVGNFGIEECIPNGDEIESKSKSGTKTKNKPILIVLKPLFKIFNMKRGEKKKQSEVGRLTDDKASGSTLRGNTGNEQGGQIEKGTQQQAPVEPTQETPTQQPEEVKATTEGISPGIPAEEYQGQIPNGEGVNRIQGQTTGVQQEQISSEITEYNFYNKSSRNGAKSDIKDTNIKVYILTPDEYQGYLKNENEESKRAYLESLKKKQEENNQRDPEKNPIRFVEGQEAVRLIDRLVTLHKRLDDYTENKRKTDNEGLKKLDSIKTNYDGQEITRGENINKKLNKLYTDPKGALEKTKTKHEDRKNIYKGNNDKLEKLDKKLAGSYALNLNI